MLSLVVFIPINSESKLTNLLSRILLTRAGVIFQCQRSVDVFRAAKACFSWVCLAYLSLSCHITRYYARGVPSLPRPRSQKRNETT